MSAEYEVPMRKLILYVIKVFYEPQHLVFMNILLHNIIITDEECCKTMKLLSREFNKIVMKLREDRLIKIEQKINTQDLGRDTLNTVYYINYAEMRDIIKYKVMKMSEAIEKSVDRKDDQFYCPTCNKTYSVLDAQAHMENFIFKCPLCKNELTENISGSKDEGIDNKKFVQTLGPLINMLKEVEKYKIPNLDYFQIQEFKNQKEKETTEKQNEVKEPKETDVVKEQQEIEDDESFSMEEEAKSEIKEEIHQVTVNGVLKNYTEVTEEDKEKMTEDEYLKYFELYEEINK